MTLLVGVFRALLFPTTSGSGPAPPSTAGQPIGLLLALTKAT